MKKTAILLSLSLLWTLAFSQGITMKSFYLNEHDQTANNEATKMTDDNNEVCALIRIQTTQKGFAFDGGTIGIVKVDDSKVGEIWLYVPAGLRRISIRHQRLGSLIDQYFPIALQPARTYIMELVCGEEHVYIDEQVEYQHLLIHVTPANATVKINGQIYETEDGVADAYLAFGKYEYNVSAKNYDPTSGHVTINDPNNRQEISVSLNPAFGWVEINGDDVLKGARVYIDNELVGDIPFKSTPLSRGKHKVEVAKNKYTTWSSQVQVVDGQTISLSPIIKAQFAQITLTTDADAEIWWNNKMIGRGSCTMEFDHGDQKFETRKVGHRSMSTVLNINEATTGTMTIAAPLPIYGSLNIEVKPIGSNIYLDNELVGTTPKLIQKVLIGKHTLRISHSGMRSDIREIEIKEGETSKVEARLSKELNVLSVRPNVSGGHCTISEEYDAIAAHLFENCKYLRTITIAPTISSIGASAFSGCYHLTAVSIPTSVKAIEEKTFYWCAALKEVTIPEGVTSIGENAFTNCYSLESITLPSTLTTIAVNAFTDCKSLKAIYVPKGKISVFKKLLSSSLRSKLKTK